MSHLTPELIISCKEKLIETKADILNRLKFTYSDYQSRDKGGGDEADMINNMLAEKEFLRQQDRLRGRLLEIEVALSKISSGTYGFCEETEEPISKDRLLAIPWTRLSIEGAEMREEMSKRYAK